MQGNNGSIMTAHKRGTREEWTAARSELLQREKELSRMSDVSSTAEATREWVTPMPKDGLLPPIAGRNASACGTDIVTYLAEVLGVDTFAREDDAVHHSYSSTSRGVEFRMGYYPILDRTPKGRDEGDEFQTWLRRRDEYDQGSE
jgi:predicted dithiol-disulfide oxidoreductase (DUF899 family)